MTFEEPKLSNAEIFLLGWLTAADWSQIGECHGPALDRLIKLGFAEYRDPMNVTLYASVRASEKGYAWIRDMNRDAPL